MVENINMRNVTVGEVGKAVLWINFFYSDGDKGEFTPIVRNISMEDVTSEKSNHGIVIRAYERSPVTGLVVKNCTFNSVEKDDVMEHVKDPQLINVVINRTTEKPAKRNKKNEKQ